ncbi:hypothetical protein VB264_22500 [Arcicella aquatica]|uniref:Uncharacterized protein n=1 Tax=Arcicella aquatica TaxID=217141 RepID=A0ABU5QUQ9_9BACT|nr:hypothetical protein [Arcicella aquatica]MEA5260585.1 hypothetical protein [Arcicella aquatica]
MKKLTFIILLISLPLVGKSQRLSILGIGKDSSALSPMMKEYLGNYQKKNSLSKPLPKHFVGIPDMKKTAENIDNLIIVKPDLAQMANMTIIQPSNNEHQHLIIISDKQSKQIAPHQ